jgi:Predicted oxidoreductases (related to aryl-alcohol dehydrogenases)
VRTRRLGTLDVTVVGLGCNNFGGRVGEEGTREVVDAALDAGVTFFDTADIYGTTAAARRCSAAFSTAGATRSCSRRSSASRWAAGERRGTREYIRKALEASLRRLETDHVELYQHHEEDPGTPLEETIGALEELVAEGKIRAYGTSNYEPATLERAKALAGRVRLGAERVLVAASRRSTSCCRRATGWDSDSSRTSRSRRAC